MFGRHRVDRVRFCIAAWLLFAAAVATAGPSRTLDRIRADGVIHLGYRAGAAPFSFKERDGKVRGYSVELCTRIASSLRLPTAVRRAMSDRKAKPKMPGLIDS